MNVGLDLGYSSTKVVSGDRRSKFPSVVGTPDKARFSFSEDGAGILLVSPSHVLIGEEAVRQSQFAPRWEDRDWIRTDEYYCLALTAMTEMTKASSADMRIVTGLPIAFYSDRDTVKEVLLGEHKPQREGRWSQVFRVSEVRVIPQPFGCLLSEALDDHGTIANANLLNGEVGIIDVGGKTTNLLSVSEAREIAPETASVSLGAWDVVRAVREWLLKNSKLDPRDHKIEKAIIAREIKERGQPIDLSDVIDSILVPMSKEVIAKATQLWNGGDALDAILVCGGGAHLLGSAIKARFPHARVVHEPVYANALGYWRFAQYLGDSNA